MRSGAKPKLPRLHKKLKLFLAPFGYHNGTEVLFQEALATGVNPEEIFYLTPSPRKLREAQVLFTRLVEKKAFIPPRFRTPRQFARELHDRYGATRYLPGELKTVLVQRLLNQPSIGYAALIANFITDVKRHIPEEEQPVLADRLAELLAGFDELFKKALVAYQTLLAYNAELTARGWVDDEAIFAQAPRYLKEEISLPRVLILDGFVAPNRLEQKLLAALIETSETILALGFGGKDEDKNYSIAQRFLGFLNSQGIFETAVLSASPASAERWQLFRFPTIEEEIGGVCRHLRRSLDLLPDREKPRFLSDTMITLPRLNDYLPFLRRLLRQYEIPFTIYPESRLASSPPIIAVLELLTALETDYERIALTAAFSSPFFPALLRLSDDKDQKLRERAARMLNSLSCRAGIIKGEENWEKIAQRIIVAEGLVPDDPENQFFFEIGQRVRQALGLTKKFLQPAGSLATQARNLKQFLEAAEFCKNLPPNEPEELPKDYQELYDILDAIAEFDDEFGSRRQSRAEFVKLLTYLLAAQTKISESDQGGVTVVSMAETLGIAPKHLFLISLTEKDLPGVYHSDPILPDRVRKELGMPDMDWHRDWQRFHLYRTIYSSRTPPFLSYHELRDNQPVLPTPFLELVPVQPEPINVIYSEKEAQLLLGKSGGKGFDEFAPVVDFTNDPEVQKELAHHFGPEKKLSITMLETYPRCPYQFYIKWVLQLETPEEPVFEIESRQWGLIIHAVLGQLYQNGAVPLEELPTVAPRILDAVLNNFNLPHFWNEVTQQVFANLLPRFIEREKALRDEYYQPVETELKLKGGLTPDITLYGRIDRIDIAGNRLRVIDYKTGSTEISTRAVTEHRTHIQLPLYAWLVQKKFPDKTIDNIGIYSLRNFRINWFGQPDCALATLVQAAIETTVGIVKNIRAGLFPAQPAKSENTCWSCPLNFTCGRETEQ